MKVKCTKKSWNEGKVIFELEAEGIVPILDVFQEYINSPLLNNFRGTEINAFMFESYIDDFSSDVRILEDNRKIEFWIFSGKLTNILSDEDVGEPSIPLLSGGYVKVNMFSDRSMSEVLALLLVVDLLDGMIIEIDDALLEQSCESCAYYIENLKQFASVVDIEVLPTCIKGNKGERLCTKYEWANYPAIRLPS